MEKKQKKPEQQRSGLSAVGRFLVMFAVLVVILIGLSIYNSVVLENSRDIESVDNLSGQKIACCVGWEADYLLSDRDDITLLRYDDTESAVLALRYKQVDAVAMNATTATSILNRSTGAELVGDPITITGSALLTKASDEDLLEELNAFLADFLQSEEYEDFLDRAKAAADSFPMADIEPVTDGPVLVVDYLTDAPPFSYLDTQTGEPEGVEIEVVKRFASACSYRLEFREVTESSFSADARSGKADIYCVDYTDVYRDSVEASGVLHMADPYLYDGIYLLKLIPGEELVITGSDDTE